MAEPCDRQAAEIDVAEADDTRLVRRAALWGLAVLMGAGALLWLKFGDAVFIDSLAFIRSCF